MKAFLSLSSINPLPTQNIGDLQELLGALNNTSMANSFSLSHPLPIDYSANKLPMNLLLKILDCQDLSNIESLNSLKEKDRVLAFVLNTIDGSHKFRAFEYRRLGIIDSIENEKELRSSYLLVKKDTILKRDTLFLEPEKTAILNENSKLEQLIQFLEYK